MIAPAFSQAKDFNDESLEGNSLAWEFNECHDDLITFSEKEQKKISLSKFTCESSVITFMD